MIVMPADQFALVGVGLLLYGVVDDQRADHFVLVGFLLEFAHRGLHQAPQRPGV
jgi:hypothetical protein